MLVFNNTDMPIDFRDRVIVPGVPVDFPNVSDQTLTPDERKAFKLGAVGFSAGKVVKVRERLRPPPKSSVLPLARLVAHL